VVWPGGGGTQRPSEIALAVSDGYCAGRHLGLRMKHFITAKSDVEKLTMNDVLIICSGTNDIDRNYSSIAFKNITNFVKSVNHTNIILISVPTDMIWRSIHTSTVQSNPLIVSYLNLLKFSAMLAQLKLSTIDFYLRSMDCI